MGRRVVVKVGSNVLTLPDGMLDVTQISSLVDQIASLRKKGIEVILISSGAVASGRSVMSDLSEKLDSVSSRQLFSAVGQVRLMSRYMDLFGEHGIVCGQVLTTKESLSTRRQYLNQRNCVLTMLQAGVLPILNENDSISVTELMFTDNDELSGLVASMMDADTLVILSNVDGIYDGDPLASSSSVIREIHHGEDVSGCISSSKSSCGRGGMSSKYRISSKAAGEGIEVVIANGRTPQVLERVLSGDASLNCTRFLSSDHVLSGVKKWVANSEGFAKGTLYLNDGACEALRSGKASSILPVGVTRVEGEFEKEDIVGVFDSHGRKIGVGRIDVDSERARQVLGHKREKALVHYDYLFLD